MRERDRERERQRERDRDRERETEREREMLKPHSVLLKSRRHTQRIGQCTSQDFTPPAHISPSST